MLVLDPTAEAFQATQVSTEFAPQPLQGKAVAILNNGWQSMNGLADVIRATLVDDHGVARILEHGIPLSTAAPESVLADVAENADVAIVGLAN